jgi:hypothetical protein
MVVEAYSLDAVNKAYIKRAKDARLLSAHNIDLEQALTKYAFPLSQASAHEETSLESNV